MILPAFVRTGVRATLYTEGLGLQRSRVANSGFGHLRGPHGLSHSSSRNPRNAVLILCRETCWLTQARNALLTDGGCHDSLDQPGPTQTTATAQVLAVALARVSCQAAVMLLHAKADCSALHQQAHDSLAAVQQHVLRLCEQQQLSERLCQQRCNCSTPSRARQALAVSERSCLGQQRERTRAVVPRSIQHCGGLIVLLRQHQHRRACM